MSESILSLMTERANALDNQDRVDFALGQRLIKRNARLCERIQRCEEELELLLDSNESADDDRAIALQSELDALVSLSKQTSLRFNRSIDRINKRSAAIDLLHSLLKSQRDSDINALLAEVDAALA